MYLLEFEVSPGRKKDQVEVVKSLSYRDGCYFYVSFKIKMYSLLSNITFWCGRIKGIWLYTWHNLDFLYLGIVHYFLEEPLVWAMLSLLCGTEFGICASVLRGQQDHTKCYSILVPTWCEELNSGPCDYLGLYSPSRNSPPTIRCLYIWIVQRVSWQCLET